MTYWSNNRDYVIKAIEIAGIPSKSIKLGGKFDNGFDKHRIDLIETVSDVLNGKVSHILVFTNNRTLLAEIRVENVKKFRIGK